MIRVTQAVCDAIGAYAIAVGEIEACGLVSLVTGGSVIDAFHPIANEAASATTFVLDPQEMLDAERQAEATGRSIVGVVHSHLDTSPYPSPTDIADSGRYDPSGTYHQLIVSLRHGEPALRSYRIAQGEVTEELLVIAEDTASPHDDSGAVAAVARLPRPASP